MTGPISTERGARRRQRAVSRRAAVPWLIAALAGAASLYAAGLLYEGFFAESYSGLLTGPFVDRAAAERAYGRLPADTPAAMRAAASARLTAGDPANPESWTAVAYADWRAHGQLTPTAIAALDHSYAMGFFDRQDAIWRVTFALQHWDAVTPQIRQDALAEARAALADRDLGPILRYDLKSVRNPAGRLAAALLIAGEANP
jgi:hypothetical protein